MQSFRAILLLSRAGTIPGFLSAVADQAERPGRFSLSRPGRGNNWRGVLHRRVGLLTLAGAWEQASTVEPISGDQNRHARPKV